MKYLRKYNENESSSEFDLDFAMAKIREHFSEDKVINMFDNEVMEWIDSDWADDYDNEYDWYVDHNNGEAQDVVIDSLLNWFKKEYNKKLNIDQHCDLHDAIKEEYMCLNY
jgi:hypothetical protein